MGTETTPESDDRDLIKGVDSGNLLGWRDNEERTDIQLDRSMREKHASNIMLLIVCELGVIGFVVLGKLFTGQLDSTTLNIAATAVVVQSFGALYIVTNYLFPKRSREK